MSILFRIPSHFHRALLAAGLCGVLGPHSVASEILNPPLGMGGAPLSNQQNTEDRAPQSNGNMGSIPASPQPAAQNRNNTNAAANIGPEITYSQTYGAWLLTCLQGDEGGGTCFIETGVRRRDNMNTDVVKLRFLPSQNSPTGLSLRLTTPNNVLLQSDARLQVASATFKTPYTMCDSQTCWASVAVSQPLLERLVSAEGATVSFTLGQSQDVNVPLMLDGLLDALRDITSRPANQN